MPANPYDLSGRVAVITGGCGVLGGAIACGLAAAGATVAILDRRRQPAEKKAQEICKEGGQALALVADVLIQDQVQRARDELLSQCGHLDILVNAAGGNVARARNDDRSVFSVPLDGLDEVLRLNIQGTVIPSLCFAQAMGPRNSGCIVNISSMAATRVLTGVLGYSIAKAGIDNFTRWLAAELARKHGGHIRVNAIAPGFFISAQNKDVLVHQDGTFTDRARAVLAHTPMGRFGEPADVVGPVLWLCSDAAAFVTGAVIPVDGGFSVFSGV